MKNPPCICQAVVQTEAENAVTATATAGATTTVAETEGWFTGLLTRLRQWQRNRADRRILLKLSAEQLRDIGLSRRDIDLHGNQLHRHWMNGRSDRR